MLDICGISVPCAVPQKTITGFVRNQIIQLILMKNTKDKTRKILIVDDNKDVLKAARLFLKRHFLQVDISESPETISKLLQQENYDLILLDMNFTQDVNSGKEGFIWLEKILSADPTVVVVLMTAYGDIQMAVKAIKAGASNFVLKPWKNDDLLATLYSSLHLRESKLEIQNLRLKQQEHNDQLGKKYQEIIGTSQPMLKIFTLIDRVAETDANILILGESGTGKELIAKAIHLHSTRNRESFVNVDLGSISETLFESELFGHKKGAFTDAREDRPGRFEIASKGTLFLDEIGNLSLPLQAKLLTALQSRKINRVGSNTQINVDIRLVCATNTKLYEMVKQNQFRQDLLYRINTIEIKVPALRERLDDIPLLANYFLKLYRKKYKQDIRAISPIAIFEMQKYDWPGNVRELQHAIERAVIISNTSILQKEDFDFNQSKENTTINDDQESLTNMKLEEIEKILIRKALLKYDGNITQTAQELGLTRTSLYRRIKKHGI